MTHLPDHDLIDLALGRLDAPAREHVERSLTRDPDAQRRFRAIRDHLDLYDRLPPPPPPRPFAWIRADLPPRQADARGSSAAPRRPWAWALGSVAAVVVAGLALHLVLPGGNGVDGIGRAGEGLCACRDGDGVLRRHPLLAVGDVLVAREIVEAWLGPRVHLVMDDGTTLELLDETTVRLEKGRAFFEVESGPFLVRTLFGDVRVRGTAFEVAVGQDGLEVRVAAGRVDVAGRTIIAGTGLENGEIVALDGEVGPWFRRPRLGLASGGPVPPGRPVSLEFSLVNPGMLTVELSGPEGVRRALWLEVVDPTGEVHDLPVSPNTFEPTSEARGNGGPLPPQGGYRLGPHERRRLVARFARPFTRRGTYRCRAMYRPEGEPPLLSEIVLVEVR